MFVLDRSSLLSAAAALAPFAESGASARVSAGEEGDVVLAVGDRGGGARVSLLGRVLLPSTAHLPLRALAGALKTSAGSRVEIAVGAEAVAVCIDGEGASPRRFTYPAEQADGTDEWPEPPRDAIATTLAAEVFAALIDKVAFASTRRSPLSGEWAVDGIMLRAAGGQLTATATDLYRLASSQIPAAGAPPKKSAAFLAPAATLSAWSRAATRGETLRLAFGERLHFQCGGLSAWCAPLRGELPPAEGIAATPVHTLTLPAELFRAAVESVLPVTDRYEPRVFLAVKKSGVAVSAVAGKVKAESVVPAVAGLPGPALSLPLDGSRLLGALKAYDDAPTVTLGYAGDNDPIVIGAGTSTCVMVPHRERAASPKAARATA